MIKVDTATVNKDRLWYARVLVDMDIDEGFPEELFYTNERDELVTQQVQYDWLPLCCSKCNQFGHTNLECRVGKKQDDPPSNLLVDEDGFRPVKSKWVRKNKTTTMNQNPTTMSGIQQRVSNPPTTISGIQQSQSYSTPNAPNKLKVPIPATSE